MAVDTANSLRATDEGREDIDGGSAAERARKADQRPDASGAVSQETNAIGRSESIEDRLARAVTAASQALAEVQEWCTDNKVAVIAALHPGETRQEPDKSRLTNEKEKKAARAVAGVESLRQELSTHLAKAPETVAAAEAEFRRIFPEVSKAGSVNWRDVNPDHLQPNERVGTETSSTANDAQALLEAARALRAYRNELRALVDKELTTRNQAISLVERTLKGDKAATAEKTLSDNSISVIAFETLGKLKVVYQSLDMVGRRLARAGTKKG